MLKLLLFVLCCVSAATNVIPNDKKHVKIFDEARCSLPEELVADIRLHKAKTDAMINYFVNGAGKGETYNKLSTFVDKFGFRMAGTDNLEHAIDYMLEELSMSGLENVHGENATVPHWVRGNESAEMLEPRYYHMNILGLGGSVGTPPQGITAEVMVVKSFAELKQRHTEVRMSFLLFIILLLL